MIRVALANEPASFDSVVRQPGLRAIAQMVGERPLMPDGSAVRGRPYKVRAASRTELKGEHYPDIWTEALPDLMREYGQICAFCSLVIPWGTGAKSVDHFVAKSRNWERVYEWSNYRLACAQVNGEKGDLDGILDPFEIEDAWFALEFVAFQVVVGDNVVEPLWSAVDYTIKELKISNPEFCKAREQYFQDYRSGDISLNHLRANAPFVFREMQRQGLL